MTSAEHPAKSAANEQPDALVAELERSRADFEKAERAARTYLAEHGILNQTRVDVASALRRFDRHVVQCSRPHCEGTK